MKIAQITDLHIGQLGADSKGVDVRRNFLEILAEVKFSGADHLVVTGDFCLKEPDGKIYNWVFQKLKKLKIPFDVIAGNHDDSVLLAETFQIEHLLKNEELFYAKKLGKQTCLFLDSSKKRHSDDQLKWLKRQLNNESENVVIFTHHPLFLADVALMDAKHALEQMDDIQEILFDFRYNINAFCGHYHLERTLSIKNVMLQITPSCYFQLDGNAKDFKIDHRRIAMRLINWKNGCIITSVHYFDGKAIKKV